MDKKKAFDKAFYGVAQGVGCGFFVMLFTAINVVGLITVYGAEIKLGTAILFIVGSFFLTILCSAVYEGIVLAGRLLYISVRDKKGSLRIENADPNR